MLLLRRQQRQALPCGADVPEWPPVPARNTFNPLACDGCMMHCHCAMASHAEPQGAELRQKAAEETWNLVPPHSFVPWVRCTLLCCAVMCCACCAALCCVIPLRLACCCCCTPPGVARSQLPRQCCHFLPYSLAALLSTRACCTCTWLLDDSRCRCWPRPHTPHPTLRMLCRCWSTACRWALLPRTLTALCAPPSAALEPASRRCAPPSTSACSTGRVPGGMLERFRAIARSAMV